ncbi:MAG TPA: flagellar biosynthesis anti-sigma factor FlgM [Syntrophorhabdaceae bacterium]|nr:flagellar biosynthesis anti-sigma factor FlgM [Syntrophorhabdaceae bacterium]
MKIDNGNKTNLLDSLLKSGQTKPQNQPTDNRTMDNGFDKVELSSRKPEINSIKERVKAETGIRQDKVDAMREAIQNQTYNVRGELVARDIMKSQLLDELL